MLQRVFIEKNINRHFSLNLSKFCNKSNCPQCLVVFAIVILGFSTIRNLLSDSVSLFVFPLVRVKATLFFFYKNIFYKNIEAEICEILRIF